MKLHLPKLLLTAVLAAVAMAPAMGEFTGPTGASYTVVSTETNSAQSPTTDTAYTNVIGPFDITTPDGGTAVNIKLIGTNTTSNEYNLGTIEAASTWFAGGRFAVVGGNTPSNLTNAGDIYVNDGCFQFKTGTTLNNNFTIGASDFTGGWNDTYANIKNAALLFGVWDAANIGTTFSGSLTVAESAKIALQYGADLTLNGALDGSSDLQIAHYQGDNSKTDSIVTLSGDNTYTGNITLTGCDSTKQLILKLTGNSLDLQTEAASISVGGNTVLDLSATTHSKQDGLWKLTTFADLNNNTKITTSGTGYVLLKTENSEITLPGNSDKLGDDPENITSISKNYKVTADLSINGAGYNKNDGRTRTLEVGSGKSFVVTGKMSLVSNAVLNISGGSVEAGSMALGHGSSHNFPYWGKISMSSGSLKTGTISLRQNYANVIDISGGTVEFTAEDVIDAGTNTSSSLSILGADGTDAKRVILKATSSDWTLDGGGLVSAKVGNVTVDAGNAHGISFANVTLSGSIVNNKKLTLLDGVSFASDAATVLSGTGTTYLSGTITTDSSLTIGGTLALGNDISVYESNGGSVSYVLDASNINATNDSQNGFQCVNGGDFWLVKGANSNLADGVTSITAVDGSTTYTLEDVDGGILINGGSTPSVNTTKYYVSNGSVDVVGTGGSGTPTGAESYVVQGGTMNLTDGTIRSSEIDYTSGAINLASTSSTLVLDSSTQDHNNSLLTLATGSGNIEIDATTTLAHGAATQISGDIIINSGKELILGRKQNPSIGSGETFGTVANIVLNGGQLTIGCDTTTLSKVSTKEGSGVGKLYIWDMHGPSGSNDASGVLTINELVVNSGMQIQSEWKSNLNIAALSGAGELQLQQRAAGNNQVVTINAGQGYTGHLNLDGGDHMTVNLNIGANATTKIKTDNSSTIDKLTLAAGSTLRYNTKSWVNNAQFEYTLKEVVVGGTNTAIKLEAEDNFWQGCVYIDKLTNAKGEDDAIIPGSITLSGNAKTSNRDVMYLKGGDFEGTITYKGASDGSNRKHALNITSTDAAAKAVIKLEANSGNIVALGIASSEVKVRGIEGTTGTIYSGEQSHMKDNGQGQQVWNSDAFAADGTTRKLTINTAGDNHATSAAIVGNLNISKSGEGKQTFSGDISQWSGNITVTAGELVFNNEVSVAEVSVTGGTLTVGTYDGTELTTEQSLTATNKATFGAGAVVNANLVLSSGATVTMAEALTMGSTLTLSTGMTLDGTMLASVNGLTEGKTVDLFKSVDSLMLGNATYDADNALAEGTVSLKQYFTNVTNEDIYLAFNNGNVFAGIMSIPEPTTATLSLLALAGLAARRRRASR